MNSKSQNGFTLIELLIVVVIIGILSAIAIPSLIQARIAAENRSAVAFLTVIRSSQMAFYAQTGRYARLDELQRSQNGSLGTDWTSPTTNQHGRFTYTLASPVSPTDPNLKAGYIILATRNDTPTTYIYTLDALNSNGSIDFIE